MKKIINVDDNFINTRLDRWFKKNIFNAPQSLLEKRIRKGNIKVNGKKVFSKYKLQKNDKVLIKNFYFVGMDYLASKPKQGHFYEFGIRDNTVEINKYVERVKKITDFYTKKKIVIFILCH